MGIIRNCLEKYTGIEWNSLGEVVDGVMDVGRDIYERYSGPAREFAAERVVNRLVERYQQEPSMIEEYGLEDPDGIEFLREELTDYCLEGEGRRPVNRALGLDIGIALSSVAQVLLKISDGKDPKFYKPVLVNLIEVGENLFSNYLIGVPLGRNIIERYKDDIGSAVTSVIGDRKEGIGIMDYIGVFGQILSQAPDIVGFNGLNTVADNTIYRGFPDSLGLKIKRKQPTSRVETQETNEKPVYDKNSIQNLLSSLSPEALLAVIQGIGDKLNITQQPEPAPA